MEESEPAGTRTQDLRINLPHGQSRNPLPANTSGDPSGPLAPQLAPVQKVYSADPDLARVVAAWPALPEAIRRAVLALVGASTPPPGPYARKT